MPRGRRPIPLLGLLVAAFVTLLPSSGLAGGQGGDVARSGPVAAADTAAARRLLLRLGQLAPGSEIRGSTTSVGRFQGRFDGLRDDRLGLTGEAGPQTFEVGLLTSLEVQGTGAARGALWGAGMGVLLGGVALAALAQGLCDRADCSGEWATGFAWGALGGGAFGGVTGLVLGSALPVWHRWWP